MFFYINGEPVSSAKAKNYFLAGLAQSIAHGYASPEDANLWAKKAKSEEVRERISDVSGIQENGGLEIVIED